MLEKSVNQKKLKSFNFDNFLFMSKIVPKNFIQKKLFLVVNTIFTPKKSFLKFTNKKKNFIVSNFANILEGSYKIKKKKRIIYIML